MSVIQDTNANAAAQKPVIVFIHGAWMNSRCWEFWIPFFETRGYECIAPDWPHKTRSVEAQEITADKKLANLGVQDIVSHYEKIIRDLGKPAVLVGHSFGGLFVQLLLDRGVGVAGVAIDPAPPKGIWPFIPTVLKAFFWILTTPFGWKKVMHITQKQFVYAFMHTRPQSEQDEVYKRYVVPETGKIFFEGATSMLHNRTRVHFANPKRAPLLFIAGTADHVCPVAQVTQAYGKACKSPAQTNLKVYEGRDHWIMGEEGWEQVAGDIEQWIQTLA